MIHFLQAGAIILAALAVAIADGLIKKSASAGGFLQAIASPWMAGAILLYVFQIGIYVYIFMHGWKLAIVGNMGSVIFGITTVLIGVFIYGEQLSVVQLVGISVAIVGVVLMNLGG